MLALFIALLLVPAATTWTVDDDGPADFTQISDAVAAAQPGDVLLVEPGTYSAFALTRRLSILGRAGGDRPHVEGVTEVTALGFTLAGLSFDALHVSGAPDRARIDDCSVGLDGDAGVPWALSVDGCQQIVVSRTQVQGSKAYSQTQQFSIGGCGLLVSTSIATLVQCEIVGASGFDAPSVGYVGGDGGIALRLEDGSRAVVVASHLEGGRQGLSSIQTCIFGANGPGLNVLNSLAILRGAPAYDSSVAAGQVGGACTFSAYPAIMVIGGTLVISGVEFFPTDVYFDDSTVIQPTVPEPLVLVDGTDAPGGQRHIRLHGPAGAPCLLVASLAPAFAPVGGFDDKLWVGVVGPHFIIPLVTTGQATPVTLNWTVPASTAGLAGLSVELQPFFPGLPSAIERGKSIAGNVAELIVRF